MHFLTFEFQDGGRFPGNGGRVPSVIASNYKSSSTFLFRLIIIFLPLFCPAYNSELYEPIVMELYHNVNQQICKRAMAFEDSHRCHGNSKNVPNFKMLRSKRNFTQMLIGICRCSI